MSRGLFVYSIVTFSLLIAASIAISLALGGLHDVTSTPGVLVMTVGFLSPPVVPFTFLVFPETVALITTAVALWYATSRRLTGSIGAVATLSMLLGILPWTHRKFSFYVIGLAMLVLIKRWDLFRAFNRRDWSIAIACFVVPQAMFQIWTWRHWGTLGGPQLLQTTPFALANVPTGALGLWLDRQHGVFSYGPLYLVALACCWLERREVWPFLVPAALLYVPMSAYIDWTAGFSTAARYIAPSLPPDSGSRRSGGQPSPPYADGRLSSVRRSAMPGVRRLAVSEDVMAERLVTE